MAFLQQVSVRTRIYSGAERFVDELHVAGQARRKPRRSDPRRAPQRFLPPAREMPDNAVFISYAREDLPAVQRLKAGAGRGRGHDVVRPRPPRGRRRLRPQDPAQHRALLVSSFRSSRRPRSAGIEAISAANGVTRSIARATWRTARVFILPVCIDDTTAREALRPGQIQVAALHATCRAARSPPEFARRLRGLPASRDRAMNDVAAAPSGDRRGSRPPPVDAEQSVAGPGVLHRGNARATSTDAMRRSPSWRAACSASCSRCCSVNRASARPRFCARASCRVCAPRVTARSTCASITRPIRRRRPNRSSRPSSARRRRPVTGRRPASAVEGESLWEFLHHRDDVLRDASGQHADPAADLRSVRGDLHAGAERRLRPRARRAIPRRPRRPRREPRAEGTRGAARAGRRRGRAVRFRAQRLPHPDRAARGLSRAARRPQGQDAHRSRRTGCGSRG